MAKYEITEGSYKARFALALKQIKEVLKDIVTNDLLVMKKYPFSDLNDLHNDSLWFYVGLVRFLKK